MKWFYPNFPKTIWNFDYLFIIHKALASSIQMNGNGILFAAHLREKSKLESGFSRMN